MFLSLTLSAIAVVGLAYLDHMIGLIPAVVLGYAALFIRHRYAGPIETAWPWTRSLLGILVVVCLLFILSYLPGHPLILGFLAVLGLMLILNTQFYMFLAGKRGHLFAVASVPFHLLYHLYNGLSFAVGLCRYAAQTVFSRAKQRTAD